MNNSMLLQSKKYYHQPYIYYITKDSFPLLTFERSEKKRSNKNKIIIYKLKHLFFPLCLSYLFFPFSFSFSFSFSSSFLKMLQNSRSSSRVLFFFHHSFLRWGPYFKPLFQVLLSKTPKM